MTSYQEGFFIVLLFIIMKGYQIILLGSIAAALLGKKSNANAATSPPITPTPSPTPPIQSRGFLPVVEGNMQIRNDPQGLGNFGAPRGSRQHNGIDILVAPFQRILSPIDGLVTRYGKPYADDPNYDLIEIQGLGRHEGITLKMFYVVPATADNLLPFSIRAGDYLTYAQSISQKFGDGMLDHLHIEVVDNGRLVDPFGYFFGVV